MRYSQVGKATDFESVIPLVRVQLTQKFMWTLINYVRLTNNQITSYLDNLQGGRLGTSDTFCVGKLTVQTSWIRLLRQTTKRINLYWQ